MTVPVGADGVAAGAAVAAAAQLCEHSLSCNQISFVSATHTLIKHQFLQISNFSFLFQLGYTKGIKMIESIVCQ